MRNQRCGCHWPVPANMGGTVCRTCGGYVREDPKEEQPQYPPVIEKLRYDLQELQLRYVDVLQALNILNDRLKRLEGAADAGKDL